MGREALICCGLEEERQCQITDHRITDESTKESRRVYKGTLYFCINQNYFEKSLSLSLSILMFSRFVKIFDGYTIFANVVTICLKKNRHGPWPHQPWSVWFFDTTGETDWMMTRLRLVVHWSAWPVSKSELLYIQYTVCVLYKNFLYKKLKKGRTTWTT